MRRAGREELREDVEGRGGWPWGDIMRGEQGWP